MDIRALHNMKIRNFGTLYSYSIYIISTLYSYLHIPIYIIPIYIFAQR